MGAVARARLRQRPTTAVAYAFSGARDALRKVKNTLVHTDKFACKIRRFLFAAQRRSKKGCLTDGKPPVIRATVAWMTGGLL